MSWRATICLGIAFLLAAGAVYAQSLAELAEREKKRREQLQEQQQEESRTFTEEDLAKGDPAESPPDATPAASPRRTVARPSQGDDDGDEDGEENGEDEDSDDEGEDDDDSPRRRREPDELGPASKDAGERAWRRRADELRQMVAERRAHLEKVEARAKTDVRGPNVVRRETNDLSRDPDNLLTTDPVVEELKGELADSREDLAYAEQVLARFLQEARRKGVPPGWVR